MAGRGRGRGKSVSFDVQALGFGRGEALPTGSLQPPPLFPTQEFKPVPLASSEDLDYVLALKQEFIATLRKSPYYVKAHEKKRDIQRYSDKYQLTQKDSGETFTPDWKRFPAELKEKPRRVTKVKVSVRPNLSTARKVTEPATTDIVKTLETLEAKESTATEEVEDEEKDEEEKTEDQEEVDEEIYDEEDLEEETDYAMNYFDNGEDYGDDDGDDDEGPVY